MGISESVKALFGRGVEKKSITLADPLAAEIFGSVPTIAGPTIGPATAIRVPAVYSAIALISGATGSLPAKLYCREISTSTNRGSGKRTADDHPAYGVIHDWANDWTSAGALRCQLTADALLFDHGYAFANRTSDDRVVEFIRLDPQSITLKHDDATGEPFYAQRQPNGRERVFSYRDILTVSAPLGMSPIKVGKEAIGLASVLERHAAQLFAGGARPSLVFENESATPEGERGATVLKRLKAAYAAWKTNGGAMFLDGGWKTVTQAFTSTDAQFLENRRFQTEEIARVFRIPPTMLFDLTRGTWSNAEEMFRAFLVTTLRSWLDEWQDAYARVLLSPEDRAAGYYVEFVIEDILTADLATRAKTYQQFRAMGAMTANEVRAGLNLPRMDGGDVLASPFTTPAPAATPAASNDNRDNEKEAA